MAGSRMGVVQHNQRGKLAGIRRRNVQGQPLFAALHGVRNRTSQPVRRRSTPIHRRQKAGVRPLAGLRFNLGQGAAPHRQDVRVSFRPLSGGCSFERTAEPNRRSPNYRYRNRRLHPSSADRGDAAQGARSGIAGQAEKRRAAQRSRTGFDPAPADFCPRLSDRQTAVLTEHVNRIGIFKRDTTEEEIARLLACQLAEPLQTTHNKLLTLLLESLSASRLITPKWQRVAGNNGCFTSKLGKPLTAKDISAAKQMAEIIDRRKERMIIDCIEALEAAE